MRALVADRSSPSGVSLTEAPEPQPAPGETLVEVKAVSLNRGEVRRLPARAEGRAPAAPTKSTDDIALPDASDQPRVKRRRRAASTGIVDAG